MNTSSSLALLSSYEDRRDEYIGYIEVCGGLGALIGPMIGSGLYYLFGYMGPFLGLGITNLIMVSIFWRKKRNIPLLEDTLRR